MNHVLLVSGLEAAEVELRRLAFEGHGGAALKLGQAIHECLLMGSRQELVLTSQLLRASTLQLLCFSTPQSLHSSAPQLLGFRVQFENLISKGAGVLS